MAADARGPVRPWLWFVLFFPFGAASGFVGVTLTFMASRAGLSDGAIAGLVAIHLLPHTWKVAWAPIADTTLTRKRWYVAMAVLSAGATIGMACLPFRAGGLGAIKTLIVLNSLAMSFLGMAAEGLLAHATSTEGRGTASGWLQAGNLGGAGVGGGLALWLAQHVSAPLAGSVLGLMILACPLALRAMPDAAPERGLGPLRALRAVGQDLFQTLASRRGLMALILCFLPLGAGAASGMFSAIAGRWGAGGDLVAITTGLLGGVVAAVGCLAGGRLSDALDRRIAYALSGVLLAVVALGMALAPRTPVTYAVFTLTYSLVSGLVYATFTGFVLEAIGRGAAATKYSALASLSNVPIWYMTLVVGWASDKKGAVAMLLTDAAAGLAGLVLFVLALALVRPGREPDEEAALAPALTP